jgi:hypothetical protein
LPWRQWLKRLYEGLITKEDIELLNSQIVSNERGNDITTDSIPTYVGYTNNVRCTNADVSDHDLIENHKKNKTLNKVLVVEGATTVKGGVGSERASEHLLLAPAGLQSYSRSR